jgi:hypothetical protein
METPVVRGPLNMYDYLAEENRRVNFIFTALGITVHPSIHPIKRQRKGGLWGFQQPATWQQ